MIALIIDASSFKTSIKNLGNKRYEISADQINEIVRIFSDFKESDVCKIVNYEELGYRAVTIQRPLRKKLVITAEGIEKLMSSKTVQKLSEEDQKALRSALSTLVGQTQTFHWPADFAVEQKKSGLKLGKPIQAIIQNAFAVDDPEGEAVLDSKGNRLWDSELKQVE